ncbi:MAG: AI-2E family transporter [Mogibacterium sp.]|nr:AI-2E family transporter [Mogibacterium sp.]
MFKKLFSSSYVKTAVAFIICGAVLIVFNNWISQSKLSLGFASINKTLMPVYLGIVFAFLLCPIYNWVVKKLYRAFTKEAQAGIIMPRSAHIALGQKELAIPDQNRKSLRNARIVATIACLAILIGVISLLIYFIVPQVIQSMMNIVENAPEKVAAFTVWASQRFSRFPVIVGWLNQLANLGTTEVINWIQQYLLSDEAVTFAAALSNGVVSILGGVVNAIIGVLIMVYLLNTKEKLFAIGRKLVAATCSERRSAQIFEFTTIVNDTFIKFVSGRIIDSAIIGVLTYIVLTIVGMPFTPMISVVVGVTNVIPFFGPFIGAIPSTLILLIESPIHALYFVIIILIIQQLDGNIIGPKIVGDAIGIDSFWVLISVLVGGGMFGFLGMALGVPVFAVIYTYVSKLACKSLDSKNMSTATVDYFNLDKYGIDASEVSMDKPQKEKTLRMPGKGKNKNDNPEVTVAEAIDEDLLIDTTEDE